MKFYNREDELQELNLLRNAMPSMIVLTGRRRVGKTELIKKFLEDETGVYFFVNSEKSEKMLIAEFSAYLRLKRWNDRCMAFIGNKYYLAIVSK